MGRQKRISNDSASSTDSTTPAEIRDSFRRHFNTQFAPLSRREERIIDGFELELDANSESEEWEGILSDEGSVEIIVDQKTPANTHSTTLELHRRGSHAEFDASRSPSGIRNNPLEDIALQKLMIKARLVDGPIASPVSWNRHRRLAYQFQESGAKLPAAQTRRAPLSHRQGMIAKRSRDELMKQRQARQNQIIISKRVEERRHQEPRIRSIDAPAIGKYSKGVLKIAKKDVLRLNS